MATGKRSSAPRRPGGKRHTTAPPARRKKLPVVEAEPDYGLNDAQVRTRIKLGYQNAEVESNSRSLKDIIVSNIFTYFNLIFFVLAAAIIAVGAWFNLTFMGVVIANIIIGIVQEWRSKKKLDSLNLLANPKANVMREGVMRTISVHDTVRDDIVELSAGDQIYAVLSW